MVKTSQTKGTSQIYEVSHKKVRVKFLEYHCGFQDFHVKTMWKSGLIKHVMEGHVEGIHQVIWLTLSEGAAHSNVYHHLNQQSICIKTAQISLTYSVGWGVSSGSVHVYLFPFVLESLHSDWLTGVVEEIMHHTFGPWSIMDPSSELQMSGAWNF